MSKNVPPKARGDERREAPKIDASDLRVARLLVFLTSLSAIALALTATLGVNAIVGLIGGGGDGGSETVAECNAENELEACGENRTCMEGQCIDVYTPAYCQLGDSCNSKCDNEGNLRCDTETNLYVLTDPPAKVCENPRVIEFIAELEKKCGNAKSCKSSDFEKYAISMNDFWNLLAEFPTTLAIHFPSGRPFTNEAKRDLWPTKAVTDHYTAEIETILDAIETADFVLLVATASRDRVRGHSDDITFFRAVQTRDWISDAIEAKYTPVRAEKLTDKLKMVQIGDKRQLDSKEYRKLFGSRSVAWSAAKQAHLRGLVERGDKVKNQKQISFRERTINQSVFIVPIPCSKDPKPESEPEPEPEQ